MGIFCLSWDFYGKLASRSIPVRFKIHIYISMGKLEFQLSLQRKIKELIILWLKCLIICFFLSERWREAAPGPDQSGGGAGAQWDRREPLGLPVQAVPAPPWPEGPGARLRLRHRLGQAQHGSGPGQVSLSLYFCIMSWFHQHSIHSSNGYWDNQSLGNENFDETCWLQLKETGNILTFHISGTQKIKLNRLNWRRKEFLCWIRWEINISKPTVINVCLWLIR